jgi:hypothetical protein
VSLIARHLESIGLPTLCIVSARDIIEAGQPPRAVFVDYPLGHTTGKPFEADDHTAIVSFALAQFEQMSTPGAIVNAPNLWSADQSWRETAMRPASGDTREVRDTSPQYQSDADRVLAEAKAT